VLRPLDSAHYLSIRCTERLAGEGASTSTKLAGRPGHRQGERRLPDGLAPSDWWRARRARSGNLQCVASALEGQVEQVRRTGLALADTLATYDLTHWEEWVRRDVGRVQEGDYQGLVSLLSAFGGMGSLNDVVIHPMNGHDVEPDQVEQVNADLAAVRDDPYVAATELKRLLDRP
jgi:hypothetical protein